MYLLVVPLQGKPCSRRGFERAEENPGTRPAPLQAPARVFQLNKGFVMGKYMLGWILGVPTIVLVVLYFVFG